MHGSMSTDKAADGGPSSTEMGTKDAGRPELNSQDMKNSVVPDCQQLMRNERTDHENSRCILTCGLFNFKRIS
jgi:hypothetical protein